MEIEQTKVIQIKYKNYKGETRIRTILPIEIWFGNTKYHTENQWLLNAYDLDKKENRDFAIIDILFWNHGIE